MVKLNEISLLWHFGKIDSLEPQIKEALNSWNRHKDTRDIVPEWITFNSEEVLTDKLLDYFKTLNLEVRYRKNVQKHHFAIEGQIY